VRRLAIVALGLAVFAAYGSGLSNQPVAEDFIPAHVFLRLDAGYQFRPVFAMPLLALEHLVGSPASAPRAYHAYSLLVHFATSLALLAVARALGMNRWTAFAAAFFFALYPRHHEPILWPAGTAHSVMTLLWMLAFFACLRARRERDYRWRAAALVLFTLSLFASEAAIVAPAVVFAYHLLVDATGPRWGARLAHALRHAAPFAAITIGYGIVLLVRNGTGQALGARADTSFYHASFAVHQLNDYAGYISYGLFPFVALRSPDALEKLVMAAAALCIAAAAAFYGNARTRFGLAWFAAGFAPYVLLVPYGNAERYFYFAAAGLSLVVGGLLERVWAVSARNPRSMQFAARGALAAALGVYGLTTIRAARARAAEWHAAGLTVDAVLTRLYAAHPTVPPDTHFYVVNVPKQIGRAMCLGAGLQWALRTHYGSEHIVASGGSGDQLAGALQRARTDVPSSSAVVVAVLENGVLVDRSSAYASPDVQALLTAHASEPR
jgi:hypothetical protein